MLAAFILAAACLLLFQGLYWLRYDKWFDWTTGDEPAFLGARTAAGHWKGVERIFEWAVSGPIELWSFVAALLLLTVFTFVRISARR